MHHFFLLNLTSLESDKWGSLFLPLPDALKVEYEFPRGYNDR